MKISKNVPISSITTMRLGGNARFLIDAFNIEDLKEAVKFAKEHKLPIFILGEGANVIGRDEGFDGVVLRFLEKGIKIIKENEKELVVEAMAGENWDELVDFTCEKKFHGIEALSGIPGSVGAAPVQNIGAYGQEICECLEAVEVLDLESLKTKWLKNEELLFGYRKSIFNHGKQAGRYVILGLRLKLTKGEIKRPLYVSLEKYIEENGFCDLSPMGVRKMVLAVRGAKLPDVKIEASSGSFFKNVNLTENEAKIAREKGWMVWEKDYGFIIPAGWLIEQAGLKGESLFGMRVSEKAALILINDSAKSYDQLVKAREYIREKVYEKFGFWLEQEPVEMSENNFWKGKND